MEFSQLSWFKQLNMHCNNRAKELIINEMRENISFPFQLNLVYISKRNTKEILNSAEEIEIEIAFKTTSNYLQKKMKTKLDISLIDWKSRGKSLQALLEYFNI